MEFNTRVAWLSNSLHVKSHREVNEARKIKLLPFIIALYFTVVMMMIVQYRYCRFNIIIK